MRRILALFPLVLFACPQPAAPDAGQALTPAKVVIGGLEHTELTEAFHEPEPWPQSSPLTDSQKALVALAKERFFELVASEHLPRGCDDAQLMMRTLTPSPGQFLATVQLNAPLDEWTGEGCCAPCQTPCVPGSCGYCSPADSCQHFVTHRALRVSFEFDETGHLHAEHLVRQTSGRQLVPAEVFVPALPPGPNRRGTIVIGALQLTDPSIDRSRMEAYLRARSRAVLACYERELRRDPSLAGKLAVHFDVTPAGRTSDVELEENALDAAVGSCVKAVVRGWVFPFKPEQNVPVVIPFSFAPAP